MHEAADFPNRVRGALAQREYPHDAESPVGGADRLRRRLGLYDYDNSELNQRRPRQADDHLGGI